MNPKRIRLLREILWAIAMGAMVISSHSQLNAQDALADRVAQLVEKLNSQDANEVKSAETALIKLGPKALPLLPAPSGKSENQAIDERLKSIISALSEQQSQNLTATSITIMGKAIRLSDAIKTLQQQSGNVVVDLREQTGQEVLNPTIDLEIDKRPFFEALDIIAMKGGLELSYYTAENAIGLLNAPMQMMEAQTASKVDRRAFVQYLEAFRVSLNRIGVTRDYSSLTSAHTANIQMELVWEPRLRPLMIKLKPDQIKAVDDQGREIKAAVGGESLELSIRAENPIVDLNLNLSAPERDAQMLKSLEVVADLTVPMAKRSLNLKKVTEKGAEVKSGKASLRLMNFESDAPVWKVTVELTSPTPEGAEELDSYRQMNIMPQVFLTKADGGRTPLNGGFSSSGGSSPNTMIYEFLFVDIPGKPEDHGILVETPGELKTIPLKWQFDNIPLP